MRLPASLTLITIGAILALALNLPNQVVNFPAVGLILILTGIVGHLLSPSWSATYRRLTSLETGEKPGEGVDVVNETSTVAIAPSGRPADATADSIAYLVRPPRRASRRTGT
jgi:hypothetical protein